MKHNSWDTRVWICDALSFVSCLASKNVQWRGHIDMRQTTRCDPDRTPVHSLVHSCHRYAQGIINEGFGQRGAFADIREVGQKTAKYPSLRRSGRVYVGAAKEARLRERREEGHYFERSVLKRATLNKTIAHTDGSG